MKELVAGNLENEGICIFEVPNINSWQSTWAKKTWMHLDVPRHINHFTPEKFRAYLEASGLMILRTSYFSCIWELSACCKAYAFFRIQWFLSSTDSSRLKINAG